LRGPQPSDSRGGTRPGDSSSSPADATARAENDPDKRADGVDALKDSKTLLPKGPGKPSFELADNECDERTGLTPVDEKAGPVKVFRLPDLLITGPLSKPKFRKFPREAEPVPVEEPEAEEQQENREPTAAIDSRGKLLGYDYALIEHQDENKDPVPGADYV